MYNNEFIILKKTDNCIIIVKKTETYIFNYQNLIHIHEISALTLNNTMNEKKTIYNKLSNKNVKKYKKTRHIFM